MRGGSLLLNALQLGRRLQPGALGGTTAAVAAPGRAFADVPMPHPTAKTQQQEEEQEAREKQQQQEKQAQQQQGDSEWLEVVDQQTGHTYFWNESTGETTELGEPRPKTRFRDRSFRGAAADARFQEGWREPPGVDRTYIYSLIGIGVGIGAGWATQFLH
ncbi:MAG: hypothetical protein J3K34DRAFT_422884 [Monoraphidium minutum]|nr:MAG: hypothetical protein J3K34DRAFT_422884 [Monoraphidium minutum]